MKEHLSFVSRKSSAAKILLFLILLLFTVHYLLTAAHAVEIRSKAAVVMEESTGRVLYGKNPNLRLLPASTTKLVTAMVALDRMNLDDVVSISEKAANVSPIKADFRVNERVTVKTLLYAALIRSANDAAVALAEAVAGSEQDFVELMNQKVLSLGITDSRFANATGLPGGEQYTTVYDLSRIMKRAMRYRTIRDIINTKAGFVATEDGRSIFLKNINKLLWSDDYMLGGKTGYTRKAGHCFVSAGEHSDDMIIVALLGAPNRETMWRESELLMDKGFSIKDRKEEPVIYFTRSDYNGSIEKASYDVQHKEGKKALVKKKAKSSRQMPKKAAKNRKIKADNSRLVLKKNAKNEG